MSVRLFYMPLLALLLLAFGEQTLAQDDYELSADEQAALARFNAIIDTLNPQSGDIILRNGLATLHVPRDFNFYDAADAEKILVDIWGNPPGQNVLGMLMPNAYSPLDWESWAVTIDYVEDGYVSDEDAADIDYEDLLKDMKGDIRDANQDRIDAGYGSIELVGWAEPPRYDAMDKKLYWAKELRFDGSDETTLNYEIRALGRHGVLNMTFIAATSQLEEINAARDSVLNMAEFNAGNRYADFDPELDKVAAYGIGALVAGKVAAKAGLLGAALLLLKKFGVFLLIGVAAFGRKLKSMFGAKDMRND
ncbi:MAG: DUF2167 domain-containing protein [Gammaproteobacteria bacterium]|nr:DUF2167 domain-containing protein [Gammaproteobacteria bacterium]